MAEHAKEHKSHARFEDKATEWDDNPTVKGITDKLKAWIVSQSWWAPPLDGPWLDFGCGTGSLTMALLRDGGLGEGGVTGVDTSRAMLEKFEKKGEGQGVTTVATELTGPGQLGEGKDCSFALAYTSMTLHHIQDCERTLAALAGYMRPGGRLLVFDIEATPDVHMFHPSDFELGNQLEHHGIPAADLVEWLEGTGMLEDVIVDRMTFQKEHGEDGAFGTGTEFTLLAVSCVRKAGGGNGAAVFDGGEMCLACSQHPVEYECIPCGCNAFCKTCAMKVATGGRCKKCKTMFTDLRRLQGSRNRQRLTSA